MGKYELDRFILGSVWMRNWDILFDRSSKQVSFTRVECSTEKVHLSSIHNSNTSSNDELHIGAWNVLLHKDHSKSREEVDVSKNDK
jgi:hypothetical protein